jgi:hypothetical protein
MIKPFLEREKEKSQTYLFTFVVNKTLANLCPENLPSEMTKHP